MFELWVTTQVTTKSTVSECGSEETTDSPQKYVFAFDGIIQRHSRQVHVLRDPF